jgi:hypothetical protein
VHCHRKFEVMLFLASVESRAVNGALIRVAART